MNQLISNDGLNARPPSFAPTWEVFSERQKPTWQNDESQGRGTQAMTADVHAGRDSLGKKQGLKTEWLSELREMYGNSWFFQICFQWVVQSSEKMKRYTKVWAQDLHAFFVRMRGNQSSGHLVVVVVFFHHGKAHLFNFNFFPRFTVQKPPK